MLSSWEDGKKFNAFIENFHSNGLHMAWALCTCHRRYQTAHRGAKLELTPAKGCIQRDQLGWLMEEARGHSLWRRVGWISSSYEEVHSTFVSIVKALKILTSGTHGIVQVSWTDELSGLMLNFSLQKWAEGNHSVQELMTLKTQIGMLELEWGNTRPQREWTWVWICEVGKWGRNYPFHFVLLLIGYRWKCCEGLLPPCSRFELTWETVQSS